ncbi:hypothetical protein TNCV_3050571 [Trichonephila clavipes]|nr:hypothetical protein TNCV_3050571 [Trichonephila clavipes]
MCCFAPPLVMGGRRSPKLQLQFLHLPCLQETEFCGRNVLFCPNSSDGRKRNFVEGMCCFAPPLVMGGRRSPKLQLQFLHLPCLQETEFCGRNVLFCPTSSDGGRRSPKLQLQFLHLPCLQETEFCGRNVLFCPTSSDGRKRNFVEGMCCFAPPLVMGGRRSPKLQLQFLQLPCLQETEFCGRNVLFCPTSSDGRSPVPKVTTAVFTFALFTGNGILWKECVVFAPTSSDGGHRSPKLQLQFLHLPCLQETEFLWKECVVLPYL